MIIKVAALTVSEKSSNTSSFLAEQFNEGQFIYLVDIINKTVFSNIFYYILTLTKNASLIITDFLVTIYKTEQPGPASLCRGLAMLENDLNLICM